MPFHKKNILQLPKADLLPNWMPSLHSLLSIDCINCYANMIIYIQPFTIYPLTSNKKVTPYSQSKNCLKIINDS